MSYPVYDAGIQTHKLQDMSPHPQPLHQSTRPWYGKDLGSSYTKVKTFIRKSLRTRFKIFWNSCLTYFKNLSHFKVGIISCSKTLTSLSLSLSLSLNISLSLSQHLSLSIVCFDQNFSFISKNLIKILFRYVLYSKNQSSSVAFS